MRVLKMQRLTFYGVVFFCVFLCSSVYVRAAPVSSIMGVPPDPPLHFEHITREQGLLNQRVSSIVQDQQGFLWFGTRDGLFRYDGYTLKRYSHNPNIPSSLPENTVVALHVDSKGYLWIGTQAQGLYYFDSTSEKFFPIQVAAEGTSKLNISVLITAIYEDRRGGLWIGTNGEGAYHVNLEDGMWVNYRHNPANVQSLSNDSVLAFHEDQNGTLWAGTRKGLNRFNRNTETWTHYLTELPDLVSGGDLSIFSIAEDQTGALWFGGYGVGLYRFDPRTEQATRFFHDPENPESLSDNKVYSIYCDPSGIIWAGTWSGGLNRLDPETGQFVHDHHDPLIPFSIGEGAIRTIYEDRAGSLWFAIDGWGLSVHHRGKTSFRYYTHNPLNANSLSDSAVHAIYQDRSGVLWLGTVTGGLNRLDPKTGQFTHYHHEPDNPHSLSGDSLYAIYEDHTGALWVGTYSGLNRLDPTTQQFTRYVHDPNDPTSLSHDFVRVINEDAQGNLWVGTMRGLDRFDRAAYQFEHYAPDPAHPESRGVEDILALWLGDDNTLWVGTVNDGLSHFDPQKNTWRYYRHDSDDPASLSHDSVYALYEDSAGRFWVGTAGGLNLLDRETGHCTRYIQQDGLPSDTIVGILEAEGYLWLSTFDGLSRFDPRTEMFKHYDRSDGLINDAYYYFSYLRTQGGELWFGGKNGIDIVDPSRVIENVYVPPVVLTDFKINNQSVPLGGDSVLPQSITTLDTLTLSHLDRIMMFEFAALNYVNPAKNRYAYKLEGFDDDWVTTTSEQRRATYTNLDAGKYVFRVRGSNNEGVWNEDGVSLAITITPAWWETWWFYVLCVVSISGIFALTYWNKVKQLRKERAMATALREKEERFRAVWEMSADAMALSDPDGIVLAANPAYLQLYGYAADKVVGNTFAVIFPDDQRQWAIERYQNIFTAQGVPPAFESTIRRADGTTRIVESRVGFLYDDGQRYAMLSSIRDITDRKQTEETLRRVNERFALATRAAHLAVWDWDIQKNELTWDDRMYELYGIERGDFSGAYEAWLNGVHPDDRAASNAASERARRGEQDYDTEFRIVRPDGTLRWLKANAQVTWDEDGTPLRMTGINYDITERKQAEDELKASLAEKEVLIQELYHRTRNTLQVIRAMLLMQAAKMPENEQVQRLVQDTDNRIMAIALVHKKLYQSQDLSRINISEYFQELARFILRDSRPMSQNISLFFDIEDISLLLDTAVPCGLILNELLSNAMAHAFPDEREGKITIRLFRNDCDMLELHVADNGIGVPQGFDFRCQDTLGLQTVFSLAEHQMQGKIRFIGDQGVKCVVEFPDTLYTERV